MQILVVKFNADAVCLRDFMAVSNAAWALQYLRWVLPSTSGMNASVMLNQMGVPLAYVNVYLMALMMIFLVCLLLLLLLASKESESLAD